MIKATHAQLWLHMLFFFAWCLFEMLSLTLKGQGYLEIYQLYRSSKNDLILLNPFTQNSGQS